MTTRVTDYAQNVLNQYNMQQVQTQISTLQAQIGSGHVAQTYDGLASGAQQLINLQNETTTINQYVTDIGLASNRLTTALGSVSSLISLATNFQTTLQNALNGQNASSMALNQLSQTDMQQAASLLNVKFDGQYIFSGTATNTQPVNLNAPTFLSPPAVYPSSPDTTYYQGNNGTLTVQADTSLSVGYSVTASSAGFEELIRGMHLAATAVTIPGAIDTPRLQEALRVTQQAISDLTTTQSILGVAQSVLTTAKASHTQVLSTLQTSISDIQNVDIAQASTNLSSAETTIQASYAVTARLSQLSLVKYL